MNPVNPPTGDAYNSPVRIAYIAHTRFPTEKAHGFQMAQVCAALANLGHDVTLITPTVWNAIRESAFAYYGVPETFRILSLRHFDALKSSFVPGCLGFAVSMLFYSRALRWHFRQDSADVLFLRSPLLLRAALECGVPVVLELHALPRWRRRAFVRMCNRCRLVVCLTRAMRDELLRWGVEDHRVTVEADGVNPERFFSMPKPELAKAEWKLPFDMPVIGYIGSLATRDTLEKGVRELVDALALLVRERVPVFGWIVGGPKFWLDRYASRARSLGLTESSIRFQGPIAAKRVVSALAACDVLVYPAPSSDHPYFLRDTSPLKLLEYLAARRPVVCADLPPVRDVVDASVVHLCPPGDPPALAAAIREALERPISNPERRAAIVDYHSWENRMARIMDVAMA